MHTIFNRVFIGNFVVMLGAVLMVCIGLIKQKKRILIVQSLQFALMGTGNLILGGVTGFLSNMLGIVRNLFSLRLPFTMPYKLLFSGIQIVLTICINKAGLIGWLPAIATILLTFSLDTEDEIKLKIAIIGGLICWVVYDLHFSNYVGFLFDVLTIISSAISIISIRKSRAEETNQNTDHAN